MKIVELEERDTLSARFRTPVSRLSENMGSIYGEIAALAGRNGVQLAGPPFAMYYNMDMDDLDVEIGFPVGKAAAGEGRVKAGKLPGGRQATTTHIGSYEAIEKAYNALTAFVGERGLETETFMYEEYLNSPEDTPPEKLATNIYFILKS